MIFFITSGKGLTKVHNVRTIQKKIQKVPKMTSQFKQILNPFQFIILKCIVFLYMYSITSMARAPFEP